MGDIGFKIADVDLNTDANVDLPYTSKYGALKVYRWGTVTVTPDSNGDGHVDITHDLNYAPAFLIFGKIPGTDTWYPIGGTNSLALGDPSSGVFGVSDSSKLRIQTIGGYSKLATVEQTFKYYLLVDKAEGFTGSSNIALTGDIGYKQAPLGVNALTAQEYQLNYSTKYKALQYFRESIKSETLTLPLMFSSYHDQNNEEYQYVDFNHGLGYPPLFFAWFTVGTTLQEIPYAHFSSVLADDYTSQDYYTDYEVTGICDSTKIRIQFKRKSVFDLYEFISSNTASVLSHAQQTITVKVLPFAENIGGPAYGE